MKDKLISLNALEKEIEHNFDMQNVYLPVHFLEAAECVEEGIVRCKDCIFGEQINDRYICINAGHCQSRSNAPDWFCADGERKVK